MATAQYCLPTVMAAVKYCLPTLMATAEYCLSIVMAAVEYCLSIVLATLEYCLSIVLATVEYCLQTVMATLVFSAFNETVLDVLEIRNHPNYSPLSDSLPLGSISISRAILVIFKLFITLKITK